jgi:hypothetical protein
MRCLHCDGKLPLYRKITHGQFCSATHRKAYWQEQERLAVERLQQTHNSLRVLRPPAPVESILGRDPGNEPAVQPAETELSGFVPSVLYPHSQGAPRMLVADPLAYELERIPGKLEWVLPEGAMNSEPPVRSVPSAGLVRLPQEPLSTGAAGQGAAPVGLEPVEKNVSLQALRPNLSLSLLSSAEDAPPTARRVGMALLAIADSPRAILTQQPFPSRMPRPTQRLALPIAPATPEIESAPVAETQPPVAEGLFQLLRPEARALALAVEPARQMMAPETLAPPLAKFPDHRVALEAGLSQLAGALPLPGIATRRAQSQSRVEPATGSVRALVLTTRPEPLQGTLVLPARQPRLAMGKGSRYPIRFRAAAALGPDAEPMEFPRFPADVPALPQAALASPASRLDAIVPETRGLVSLNVKFGPPPTKTVAPILSNVATIPQPLRTEPIRPASRLEPLDEKPVGDLMEPGPGEAQEPRTGSAVKAYMWSRAAGFWKLAPRDLKLLAFAIPALLALAFHRELPKVHLATTPPTGELRKNFTNVVNAQWTNVRRAVVDRAAVALDEDFRSGLDDWASRGDATADWSFDATGFVKPGPLALYRPSMNLTDYQVQFLGMIDKKALSWVVRAADFENYYVLKLVVLKPGPRTTVGLTRYAVIHGKAVDRVDTVVPMEAQPDTLYRVRLELNGDDFSLGIQGQMVDNWSEPRLPRGGVGFFTSRGEESRLRWVALTHQYDMLGRLCAYLAPYETPTTNGSW